MVKFVNSVNNLLNVYFLVSGYIKGENNLHTGGFWKAWETIYRTGVQAWVGYMQGK